MPVAIAGGPCALFGGGGGEGGREGGNRTGAGYFISQFNWLPGV